MLHAPHKRLSTPDLGTVINRSVIREESKESRHNNKASELHGIRTRCEPRAEYLPCLSFRAIVVVVH
jgi:hypothetical protein